MGKYRKLPVVIEAITWGEMLEHANKVSENKVNGVPYSFEYNGYNITHETDECYIIPTLEGNHNMTPQDMLITGVKGELYPCKADIFYITYEKI